VIRKPASPPANAEYASAFNLVMNILWKRTSLNQSQSTYKEMNCGRKNRAKSSTRRKTIVVRDALPGMQPPHPYSQNRKNILPYFAIPSFRFVGQPEVKPPNVV
jgi:hypothetical protein